MAVRADPAESDDRNPQGAHIGPGSYTPGNGSHRKQPIPVHSAFTSAHQPATGSIATRQEAWGHMGQMWSTIRRRALIGLITAVCASTAWSPSAQAAPSKSAGNEVAAVGPPPVITLTQASPPTPRKPNNHGKPLLGADTDGLAEAKKRAGHMAATTTPSVATSQPQAGIFNGANQPGPSAGGAGFC